MKPRTTRRFRTVDRRYAVILLCLLSIALVALFPVIQHGLAQQQASGLQGMSANALNQIAALVREKLSRTPTQRKIDSQILSSIRVSKGQYVAEGIRQLQTDVQIASDGTTILDIKTKVTSELLETIKGISGEIISSVPRFSAIRARVPLGQIEYLAGLPDVQFIGRPAKAELYGRKSSQDPSREPFYERKSYLNLYQSPAFELRASRVRRELPDLLSYLEAWPQSLASFLSPTVGIVTSEGDKTHQADQARAQFGVDGTGVKIGVLSDSVDALEVSQAAGELGEVTVLPGQSGIGTCGGPCSGEGTAMLEIIHDLAPGAQLISQRLSLVRRASHKTSLIFALLGATSSLTMWATTMSRHSRMGLLRRR